MVERVNSMIKLNKKYFNKLILGFIAVVVLATGSYAVVQAHAYKNRVYGKEAYHGYFTDTLDYYGAGNGYVLPVESNNQAIPNSIDTSKEFIDFLQAAYNSGNSQRHTGASFIVHTMQGINGIPAGGKVVDVDDWKAVTDFVTREDKAGLIDWDAKISDNINSYYQGGGDDAFYAEDRTESGIRFRNPDGSVAYKLIRRCGNPIGDSQGMINVWDVKSSTSVLSVVDSSGNDTGDKRIAKPTDTITWKHRIINKGPDETDKIVSYWRVDQPAFPYQLTDQHDVNLGFALNQEDWFLSLIHISEPTRPY